MKKIFLLTLLLIALAAPEAAESVKTEGKKMISVLELGVRNDGSEDVSDIVNRATAEHGLYFPAGIYKVAKPLYLKNPVRGAGYCRNNKKSPADTWFVSAMENADESVGVLNYAKDARLNVENLNIECHGQECGIRIADCSQATMTLIDRVGIYNVRGYGIRVTGGGSRPVFLQNLTIFGSADYPVPGIAISAGTCDNRIMNVEAMGCRIGLELPDGALVYGSNLHLWTGCMSGHDNGSWWRGTRGLVLHGLSMFVGSQIYPDTCFYALEETDPRTSITIDNVMYWEDTNTKGSPDFDGAFFHCTGEFPGHLRIHGGYIGVMDKTEVNGRMPTVCMTGQDVSGVLIRTDVPLTAANVKKLCAGDALPDYSVTYKESGFCKVADLFDAAETGFIEAVLTADNGACWRLAFTKLAGQPTVMTVKPQNALASEDEIKMLAKKEGILSVYVKKSGAGLRTYRFTTRMMSGWFRPVDHATLRTRDNRDLAHEVREKL